MVSIFHILSDCSGLGFESGLSTPRSLGLVLVSINSGLGHVLVSVSVVVTQYKRK